jgi:threonylcarbamoyladenosine tRNA methylthiotransferase MtaB
MIKTFSSFAFGCRVNEAEKIVLDRKLIGMGFEYAEDNPDIIIINSCAVTQKAEHEVRQFIHQTRKNFPQTKIFVTGCAATEWIKSNSKIDGVEQLIPNSEKDKLVQLFDQLNYQKTINDKKNITSDKFMNSGRMMVKIQDGCNRFCTYCIVPSLRGKPTTKTLSGILSEIKSNENTLKEIILTAINTEFFGINTNETLTQLLDAILKETEIPRISFGSINPWSIDSNFLEWYENNKTNSRFIHFFHIPIQSGSDRILRLMNRGYTAPELTKKLNALYAIDSKAFFGTDVIVGFPGEKEIDFRQSYEFLEKSPFLKFHVFRYSARPNTVASQSETKWGEVNLNVKISRAKKLRDLSIQKTRIFTEKLIGSTGKALFLSSGNGKFQDAIFDNQMILSIGVNSKIIPGEIKQVKITGFEDQRTQAELSA